MAKLIGFCPACHEKLSVRALACNQCGLELRNDFELTAFDYLSPELLGFLMVFLQHEGNLKAVQSELGISYPNAKTKLNQILIHLNLNSELRSDKEGMDMANIMVDSTSVKASEIIKAKLKACGGRANVRSINGKEYEIRADLDGRSFLCNELPIVPPYEYAVFDVIVDLLRRNGGKAYKGNGRNYKLGQSGCEETTIVGAIAKNYAGKKAGQSVFDPVFVLVAVLDWADIARNERGYIELTPSYKKLCANR
jgi:hypothetical protein